MEDALKKITMVGSHTVELFSLDGVRWSSDLGQLERYMKEHEKERAKVLADAKKFFQSRPMVSGKSRI